MEVFLEKTVPKNFAIFTGTHRAEVTFKVAGL